MQLAELFNTKDSSEERITMVRDFYKIADEYKAEYLEALTEEELQIIAKANYILRDKTEHWLTNILSNEVDLNLKNERKYMAAQTHALRDILWSLEETI